MLGRRRAKYADVAMGNNPAAAKKSERLAETFEALAELYVDRYAHQEKTEKSAKEDQRIINAELLPRWRNANQGHPARGRDRPARSNRTPGRARDGESDPGAHLQDVQFRDRAGFVELNPVAGVGNPGGAEEKRDRVLSGDEIRKVWAALEAESNKVRSLFHMLLLTAQRKSEVAGMTWGEVDFEFSCWTIPKERSKNNLAHRVPLTPSTLGILRELHDENYGTGAPVFPGNRMEPAAYNLSQAPGRITRASGVDFRIHDLRRTVASQMTSIGTPRLTVAKILNHVERDITATYDRHSYDLEKRDALMRWDRQLGNILASRSGQVTELRA
jgi:integrase